MDENNDIPATVWLAAAGWYAVASALLLLAFDSKRSDVDVGAVAGEIVAADSNSWPAAVSVVGGLVVLLLCFLLLIGQGWSLLPLVVLTTIAILICGAAGRFETVVLMSGLVLGTAPLLGPRALSHVRTPAREVRA